MRGWRYEGHRHSLAARGIKTNLVSKRTSLNGLMIAKTIHGIPITVKDMPDAENKYPVNVSDVKESFDKMPYDEVVGITEINFRKPGIPATKQDKAWAQYARTDKRINIFTQKHNGKEFSDVDDGLEHPHAARKHMLHYVLPHEQAHHTIQYVWGKKDDPMIVEEARADAMAYGYNPLNKKIEQKFVAERERQFGPRGSV